MSSALIFDLIILGLAAVLGIGGIMAGLVRELAGLCGVLVGVFVSTKYAEQVGNLLLKYGVNTENHTLLNVCGFMILLIIIWGAFIIAGKVISKALKISGLGIIDRIFGFIFGAGKFIIIASVIASCINVVPFLNTHVKEYLSTSKAWPILIDIGKQIAHTQELVPIASKFEANNTDKQISQEVK